MRDKQASQGLWPTHIFGPLPGLRELNVICWGLFVGCILIPISFNLLIQIKNGTPLLRQSAVDFVYFYGTGRIVADHSVRDVYNYPLQLAVFNQIQPLHEGKYGPSPYPPFVPLFFRQFARMPFAFAYLLWICISFALYIAGLAITLRDFFPARRLEASLIACFALSFYPFLFSTLFNGQLSCVAFFALAIALSREKNCQPFQAGVALSVLAYKPTLLLLVLPMLLLTRRYRTFTGFIVGTCGLVCLSTLLGGTQVWPTYVQFVNSFAHISGLYGETSLRLWQFNDLNSFSYSVAGGRTPAGIIILVSLSTAGTVWLAALLRKSRNGNKPEQYLAWAATLTWSMLVNLYYPIYDTILIAISIVLSIAAARQLNCSRCTERVIGFALLVFGTAWITESVAKAHGIHLLTLAILALGVMQMVLLRRAIFQGRSRVPPVLLTA